MTAYDTKRQENPISYSLQRFNALALGEQPNIIFLFRTGIQLPSWP